MAFKQIILQNAANTTEKVINLRSSSTVISCVSGSCAVSDVSDGGDNAITTLATGEHIILDFYPGADIKTTATAAGTTVTFAKTDWKNQ